MAKFQKAAEEAQALAAAFSNGKGASTDFAKSLTTGNDVVLPGGTGGAALRRQDLADDVKNLTYTKKDFTIFNLIPRGIADSTAYEYTIQDGYGDAGSSRFVGEMDIASINDIDLERKVVSMKIISDTRQASILSLQVNNTADPLDKLLDAAMITIAKTIEYGIFYGDADLSAKGAGQGFEFDGLKKLIPAANVIDLGGKILTETDLNAAAVKIAENYGTADSVFMPVGVQAAFVNNQLNRQWVSQGSASQVASGFNVPTFFSSQGALKLYPSTIMMNDKILNRSAAIDPQAPLAPVVTTSVKAGAGKFADSDLSNDLHYAVRLVSAKSAKSAPAFVDAKLASNTSEVTLDINLGVQIIGAPQHVEIFRKDEFTGNFFLIGRVPFFNKTVVDGAFHVSFVDANEDIPGTADVFVGSMDHEVVELVELASMQRLPLATIKASVQFTVLWQGALALYAPKKFARLKNVKSQVY